ncbi:uncharacterized protein LOC105184042 [Harpegnathos saltator]|uniref:uncharacterized protein LOC105184042 n=1 Tax=Harpegnathos saltator TaxID=610380 RepID=UPI000DBEE6D0|nr:uncharacterized protein LOC105184042 [Harpegnathos saltator]
MDTEEICSINIFPLVTIPFAVQWSPDNQISLITEGGVHVLELQPSPMSPNPIVKFTRSFVNATDILPACAFENEIESMVWKLERKEVYSLLMEEAITPKLENVNDTVLRIIKVEWSPKNLIYPSQCILAILTAAGAIELLHKVSNEWYSICDISALRLNIVQKTIKSSLNKCVNSPNNVNKYVRITDSMRMLQACSMAWSELFQVEKNSFAYFAVAYRSGDISIWKIHRISDFKVGLKPTLVCRIELKITVKINVLCWISINENEHLLIVGYINGCIYGVKLIYDTNSLEIESIVKYTDNDRIAINYIHVIYKDKSSIKILAVKGVCLLLLCINWTGLLKNIQYLRTEGFNITGISSITAEKFLISTQQAHIFILDTRSNDLMCIDITTHLPQMRVQYLGLAHSPNKVMFINITSPNMVFDHLLVREPTTIHIFALKGATWDPLAIINSSTNLKNIWDCIEVLRVKAAKAEDPSTVLCPTINKLESSPLYDLQISMWLTVMINVCKVKKSIPSMDHIRQSKISQELPLIFIHSACAYLNNLVRRKVIDEQKRAATLLRKYLKVYLANEANEKDERDEKARQCAREALKKTNYCTIVTDKCDLCREKIDDLSWAVTSCPSGHKLPRCAMTLLQIMSLEYLVCRICGQMFHSCLMQENEEPCCQFCDIPLVHSEYALDLETSELYGRNLSQLRVNVAESSKEQDLEEPHKRQSKNDKWDTLDTYAIIVNNGDNESDRITETWKEF